MKKQTALLAILGLASGVFAQSTIIYSPAKAIKDQSLSLKAWGSGTISETESAAYRTSQCGALVDPCTVPPCNNVAYRRRLSSIAPCSCWNRAIWSCSCAPA